MSAEETSEDAGMPRLSEEPEPRLTEAPPERKTAPQGGLWARLWTRPNQRILGLLAALLLLNLVTRVNGCDYRGIADAVVHHEEMDGIRNDVRTGNQDILARLQRLEQAQTAHIASTAAANGKLDELIGHSSTAIYSFHPKREMEPDRAKLRALQDAIKAGAKVRVTHTAAAGNGRSVTVDCVYTAADENGAVICMSPVLAANTDLADGRRYQEVIRHDGTITMTHWGANGENVQGAKLVQERTTTWMVEMPFGQ